MSHSTDSVERDAMRKPIQMWPGCLIQAIDYLHEMRVKHKDLKPANILVMGDQLLIADFGVSKDLIDEETTASLTEAIRGGTPIYWAPEVDPVRESDPSRRGRSVDIYALGCIFLEMASILAGPPGSLADFAQFRETQGSKAYRKCPAKLLQWIWYLWGHWSEYSLALRKKAVLMNDFMEHGTAVSDLAFLMLDPNPKMRITARQLVALTNDCTEQLYYRTSIKKRACSACSAGIYIDMYNLPLHSYYKDPDILKYPKKPEDALATKPLADWETTKRAWLSHHMWW